MRHVRRKEAADPTRESPPPPEILEPLSPADGRRFGGNGQVYLGRHSAGGPLGARGLLVG